MFIVYAFIALVVACVAAFIISKVINFINIGFLKFIAPILCVFYVAGYIPLIGRTYLVVLSLVMVVGFVFGYFKFKKQHNTKDIEFLSLVMYMYAAFIFLSLVFLYEHKYTVYIISTLLAFSGLIGLTEDELSKLEKRLFFTLDDAKDPAAIKAQIDMCVEDGRLIEIDGMYANAQYYEYTISVYEALKSNQNPSTIKEPKKEVEKNIKKYLESFVRLLQDMESKQEYLQNMEKSLICLDVDDELELNLRLLVLSDYKQDGKLVELGDEMVLRASYERAMDYLYKRASNIDTHEENFYKTHMDSYLQELESQQYSFMSFDGLKKAFCINQTPIQNLIFPKVVQFSLYSDKFAEYFDSKINNKQTNICVFDKSVDTCLKILESSTNEINFVGLKNYFSSAEKNIDKNLMESGYYAFEKFLIDKGILISFYCEDTNIYITKRLNDYFNDITEALIKDKDPNNIQTTQWLLKHNDEIKSIFDYVLKTQYEFFDIKDYKQEFKSRFAFLYLSYLLNKGYFIKVLVGKKEFCVNGYLYYLVREKIVSLSSEQAFEHKIDGDEEEALFGFCEEVFKKLNNLGNQVEYVNSIASYDESKKVVLYIILEILKAYEKIVGIEFEDNEAIIDKAAYDNYAHLIDQQTSGRRKTEKSKIYDKTSELLINSEQAQEYIVGSLGFLSEELFIIDIDKNNKTKFYFSNTSNMEDYNQCACCGAVYSLDISKKKTQEWYCSDICRQTENSLKNKEASKSSSINHFAFAATMPFSIIHVDMNTRVFNNPQGHGVAAEYMNDRIDTIFGRSAKLLGNDNAKNGADRIVNGVEIQTKYYSTATRSVNAGFDKNGMYKYIGKDGKPMQLEVPKDQYEKAVSVMREKIESGKVAGVKDPNMAEKLVRKGNVTYEQAKNYSKFCSKESLMYDATTGAVASLSALGISGVIGFSLTYMQTKDLNKAVKVAIINGIKSGGMAFCIYMLGAQIQRIASVNALVGMLEVSGSSAVGKALVGAVGSKTGATAMLRGTIVTSAATMVVTSGLEVYRMMNGKISKSQCIKNIGVNAGGIAGGAAGAVMGASLGSVVPVAGTAFGAIVGGAIGAIGGSSIVKGVLDKFIEDDMVIKVTNLSNQMIYLSQKFMLSEQEQTAFQKAVESYIENFENFYEDEISKECPIRECNAILKPILIQSVIVKRNIISLLDIPQSVIESSLKEITGISGEDVA